MKIDPESIKKALRKKRPKATAIPASHFVSTGYTPLNLALSGHQDRGLAKGLYMLLVGQSSSGKTWLSLAVGAEVCHNPAFDDYKIIYDGAEYGNKINIRRNFGSALADRLEPPRGTKEEPEYSSTLEEFYANHKAACDAGPCYYILDSMDALVPEGEIAHDEKKRKAKEEGTKAKGSYLTDKPKENSRQLRLATNRNAKSGSMLVIIAQTRHNIGFDARYNPYTRSGGDAMRFYARYEAWVSTVKNEWKKVGTKKIKIGQFAKVKVTKNHVCGWEGEVIMPLFRGVGIDEVGGCIDHLVDWGHWSIKNKRINAEEFGVVKKREDLAAYIEETEKVDELRKIVVQSWNEVEAKSVIKRKPRYE